MVGHVPKGTGPTKQIEISTWGGMVMLVPVSRMILSRFFLLFPMIFLWCSFGMPTVAVA